MQKHLTGILTILVIVIIAVSFYRNPDLRSGKGLSQIPPQYVAEFNLEGKDPATRSYFSPRLGVGFTYLAPEKLRVWESGSSIHVGDKTLEVFTIEPVTSISLALRDNFLAGTTDEECYVGLLPLAPAPYQTASINYPIDDSTDQPWWETESARNCPEKYRVANGISYFLFNTQVPNKVVFVKLGQDTIATDGTTAAEGQSNDWSQSIRIVK